MTSIDDYAKEARNEIVETQKILKAYEHVKRCSEKRKLSKAAYIKATYSHPDLKWLSPDGEAADAVAAVDLMKAVEKLMFAVYVGWSYHPHPVVSSAEKAAIDMTDQALHYIDTYLEATDERP